MYMIYGPNFRAYFGVQGSVNFEGYRVVFSGFRVNFLDFGENGRYLGIYVSLVFFT